MPQIRSNTSNPIVAAPVVRTLDELTAACPLDTAAIEAGCRHVEALARRHLLRAFQNDGLFLQAGREIDIASLQKQLRVAPAYERLLHVLIDLLAKDEVLAVAGGRVTVLRLPPSSLADCLALREALLADHPDRAMLIPLVEACAPEALAVVGGRKLAVEVLFPGGSSQLVENVYAKDAVSRFFNELASHAVEALVRSRVQLSSDRVQVLEIGAGTGGTSAGVLERLEPYATHVAYDFTDISTALLQGAQATLSGRHSNVRYRALDIGRDPVAQGFEAGSYDIVIAANVLHATRDIGVTLRHVRKLLRRGGVLVLNEVTRAYHFTTLTFGLTPGWWLFEDAVRIPGAPLLAVDGWRRALMTAGLSDVHVFTPFRSDTDQPPQALFVAVSADEERAPAQPRQNGLIWQQLQIIDAQLELLRAKRADRP